SIRVPQLSARRTSMDFDDAIRDLDARQPESMPRPSRERISKVVNLLDHPELTYPSIHVTGTNGKTTTARLVTALACAHGFSTGTSTSPQLESSREPLSPGSEPISGEEFGQGYGRRLPYPR